MRYGMPSASQVSRSTAMPRTRFGPPRPTTTYSGCAPCPAEVLAQRVGHGAEGLEDVGVVALAADDEQHVALAQPVLEADPRHRLHLLVGRVAAEVRGDDRVVAQHLGDQRVGAAAEGRREDRALGVDHVDVALPLVGAQRVDLLLEVAGVGGEQVRRQVQPLPARVVTVEAALEVAGHRRQPAARVGAQADRVQLQRGHAVVVEQVPQVRQVLHQRRDDGLRRLQFRSALATTKAFSPVSGLKGTTASCVLSSSSMSMPP